MDADSLEGMSIIDFWGREKGDLTKKKNLTKLLEIGNLRGV